MKESDIRPRELFDRYLDLAHADAERLVADSSSFVAVPCPACGEDAERAAFEKSGFRYVTCAACDSLYASPRPSPEAIEAFYADAESVRFWSTHFYRETADERRERMFRPRAQLTAELADVHGLPPTAVLTDVGSGYGIFLEEARATGRFGELIGIEPSPELAQASEERGFRVLRSAVEDVSPDAPPVDLATSFEVLEHVFDPVRFLAAVRGILRPGGIALLTTLTASGFDLQLLWERSKSVHPPHHLNLATVEGLELLVARAGLELVELTTPGQLDVDIVVGMLEEDPALDLPRFARTLLARDEETRARFQAFLRESRLSSHVRVVARRA